MTRDSICVGALARKHQIKLNVRLYQDSKPLADCQTKHINQFGMCVEGPGIRLPKHTALELEVLHDEVPSTQQKSLFPVVVTSSAAEGMGLMVKGSDASTFDHWQDLISGYLN